MNCSNHPSVCYFRGNHVMNANCVCTKSDCPRHKALIALHKQDIKERRQQGFDAYMAKQKIPKDIYTTKEQQSSIEV